MLAKIVYALLLHGLQAGKDRVVEEILGVEVGRIGGNDDDVRVPDEQLFKIDGSPPFTGFIRRRVGHAAEGKILRAIGDDLDLVGDLVDVKDRRKRRLVELGNLFIEGLQRFGLCFRIAWARSLRPVM